MITSYSLRNFVAKIKRVFAKEEQPKDANPCLPPNQLVCITSTKGGKIKVFIDGERVKMGTETISLWTTSLNRVAKKSGKLTPTVERRPISAQVTPTGTTTGTYPSATLILHQERWGWDG